MNSSEIVITVQPLGRRIVTTSDKTIFEALKENGIIIRSICGGVGTCGKCKVKIVKGEYEFKYDPKLGLLTKEELEEGYVLACRTRCLTDCEIYIPPETRIGTQKLKDLDFVEVDANKGIIKIIQRRP